MQKKPCACCGYLTLDDGSIFDICPVCFWQDDQVQNNDPSYAGGANAINLTEAKVNFAEFGAIEKRFLTLVRLPLLSELVL